MDSGFRGNDIWGEELYKRKVNQVELVKFFSFLKSSSKL